MEEEEFFQINRPKDQPAPSNSSSYETGPYVPIKNPVGMIYDYFAKEEPKPQAPQQSEEFLKISNVPPKMGWEEVGRQAIVNLPSSAVDVGKSMVQPILHPIETAQAVGQLGKGLYSKASGALGVQQDPEQKAKDEAAANAVGEYFSERYGSMEGFKQALAKDPAGVMADLSVPLTLGGGAAARAPGMLGKVGELTSAAGKAIDPVNLALKGTSAAVEGAAKYGAAPLMSLRSGASVRSLQQAVDAGATANPEFWKFYTKQGTPDQVIDSFNQAIKDVRDARNAEYQTSMQGIRANSTPLSFRHIDDTFNKQLSSITSLGKTSSQTAQTALKDVYQLIDEWKSQPNRPGANSMADMDALKQRLSELRNQYKGDANADRVISNVRKSVYDTIAARDPQYAKIMEAYGDATRNLGDIRSTLQTDKDVSVGKKIRSLLKTQGSTAGKKIMDDLDKYNPDLKYMLAGMELSELLPYGKFRQQVLSAESVGQALGQYATGLSPILAVGHAATVPFMSPAISGATMGTIGAIGGVPKKGAELYNKIPAMVRMPSYAVGRTAEEAAPEERAGRASGGKVEGSSLGARLVAAAERAKKEINKSTEPLLQSDDESIAKALEIANRHI